jgi:hypothetical protein
MLILNFNHIYGLFCEIIYVIVFICGNRIYCRYGYLGAVCFIAATVLGGRGLNGIFGIVRQESMVAFSIYYVILLICISILLYRHINSNTFDNILLADIIRQF